MWVICYWLLIWWWFLIDLLRCNQHLLCLDTLEIFVYIFHHNRNDLIPISGHVRSGLQVCVRGLWEWSLLWFGQRQMSLQTRIHGRSFCNTWNYLLWNSVLGCLANSSDSSIISYSVMFQWCIIEFVYHHFLVFFVAANSNDKVLFSLFSNSLLHSGSAMRERMRKGLVGCELQSEVHVSERQQLWSHNWRVHLHRMEGKTVREGMSEGILWETGTTSLDSDSALHSWFIPSLIHWSTLSRMFILVN